MTVTVKSLTNYQVEVTAQNHQWISDEPEGVGDDAGPDPYDLLLGALGACKVMTVLMYARRKEWPVEGVQVDLRTYKIHARDCEECVSDPDAKIDRIECDIRFEGDLSPEQLERLKEISDRCPVHRTLTSEVNIRTQLVGV